MKMIFWIIWALCLSTPAHAWLIASSSCGVQRYYFDQSQQAGCDGRSNANGTIPVYEFSQIDSSSVDEGLALNGWINLRNGLSSPADLTLNASLMQDTDGGLPRAYASYAYRADYGYFGAGGAVAAGGILLPDGINPHGAFVAGAAAITVNVISGDNLIIRSNSLPDGTAVKLRLSQHAHGVRYSDSIGDNENSHQDFYFAVHSLVSASEGGSFINGLDYCVSTNTDPGCVNKTIARGPARLEFVNDDSMVMDVTIGQGLFLYNYMAFRTSVMAAADWYGNGGMAINSAFDGFSTVSNTFSSLDEGVWIEAASGHNYMENHIPEPSSIALAVLGLCIFRRQAWR